MCWVYAYKVADSYCKVGYSERNWNLRVKHVKGWMGDDPELIGLWHVEDKQGERDAHEALAQYLVSLRRELFAVHPSRCLQVLVGVLGQPVTVEPTADRDAPMQLELSLV